MRSIRATWPWFGVITNSCTHLGREEGRKVDNSCTHTHTHTHPAFYNSIQTHYCCTHGSKRSDRASLHHDRGRNVLYSLCTHMHTQTHTHTHMHTHTHIHMHTHTHTHTHTPVCIHTQSSAYSHGKKRSSYSTHESFGFVLRSTSKSMRTFARGWRLSSSLFLGRFSFSSG